MSCASPEASSSRTPFARQASSENSSSNATSTQQTTVPQPPGALNFGGFYATTESGVMIKNPLANNTASCPTGFRDSIFFGTNGPSYGGAAHNPYLYNQTVHLCSADFTIAPIGVLGGIYSPGFISWNLGRYDNPVTKAQTCPTGFTPQQILGDAAHAALIACYCDLRTAPSTLTVTYAFGGIYGGKFDSADQTNRISYYSNQVTNTSTCPSNFTPVSVYGTPTRDYPIWLCLQPTPGADALTNGGSSDGTENGLIGKYYNGCGSNIYDLLTCVRVLNRKDMHINFLWGRGESPAPGVQTQWYRVQWTGYIVPRYSETYTFQTYSDDGVVLTVNNLPVINHWGPQNSGQCNTGQDTDACRYGTIALNANQPYAIRLDYFNWIDEGLVRLYWASPSQTIELVPSTQVFSQY